MFYLSIYQTPNIYKLFSENDNRAFDTAEILVELKTMIMFAYRKAFYKRGRGTSTFAWNLF